MESGQVGKWRALQRFDSDPRYSPKIRALVTAASMVASAGITIVAGARSELLVLPHSAAATPHSFNLRLQELSQSAIYHVSVIKDLSARPGAALGSRYPCEREQTATTDQIVIDPVEDGWRSAAGAPGSPSLADIVGASVAAGRSHILLRAGVYHLNRPLLVTKASGALTIQACPGETPVIEGPMDQPAVILQNADHVALIGLVFAGSAAVHILLDGATDCTVKQNTFLHGKAAILLDHASRNQIVRNLIHDVASTGIELKDASDDNLVADNVVDGARARETLGGGIFLHGVSSNRIAHNSVSETAGFGIGLSNWDDATVNVGNVIEYNLLRHTVLDSVDSGAIYILGRSGIDTGSVIAGNVIDGFGSERNHNVGIYLDDSTNGATVIGNLIRDGGSDAIQIHGGQDNLIENNLLDLGSGPSSAVLFQAAPADTNPLNRQTGNAVLRNVIISAEVSPHPFIWYDGGTPTVAGNLYVLPPGSSLSSDIVVDQDPHYAAATDYATAQTVATQMIGFKPIDVSSAGVRPVREP